MRGHRAEANLAALFANVRKVFDAAKVDQQRRLGQTQLHRRNQTRPAGENLCVFVLRQQRERFIKGVGPNVIELCCDHFLLSFRSVMRSLETLCLTPLGRLTLTSVWTDPSIRFPNSSSMFLILDWLMWPLIISSLPCALIVISFAS